MTAPLERSPGEKVPMTVSTRDTAVLGAALRDWLAGTLATPDPPVVANIRLPDSGGLSSTSVLFDAEWAEAGVRRRGSYVARMAPEASAVPVFPAYDIPGQHDLIAQVARHTTVPVPALRWNEPDGGPLGTPFFVMDQVAGRIPLDNPPYVFTGWLLDASDADRDLLQRETVRILADLHEVPDAPAAFPGLRPPAGADALRWHVQAQHDYYRWALADEGYRIPIIERGLARLEDHWPADPGPPVLSWGDARIGNVIYDGFTPAAVLDWEMAALGPREIDVGWFLFLHRFFQDIAEFFELPGLPRFCRRSDVAASYAALSGHELRYLDFYVTYAAVRQAIVMARVKRRMIHFGEDQVPADPDDYVLHRAGLERLLAGTYRWD